MANNKETIKTINRTAIIQELIEKTKNCSLSWSESSAGQYKAELPSYIFYLTKNYNEVFNLDILKNNETYTAYNSILQSNVKTLFEVVELINSNSDLNKFRKFNEFLSRKGSCRESDIGISNKNYNMPIQSRGSLVSGSVSPTVYRRRLAYLNPTQINYDPTDFPWAGTHEDINDFDIAFSDLDASYIRQEIVGSLPTIWGYVDIGFDLSTVPKLPPFAFNARVAHRRESEIGVALIISVFVNGQNVYATTVVCDETYSLWISGTNTLLNIDKIDSFFIRLNMYTNSGNLSPRAVRVTGVDLGISGIDSI